MKKKKATKKPLVKPEVQNERLQFSLRLKEALKTSGNELGATEFARNFNARSPHQAVTVGAARKWLFGETFPSQTKLRAMAEWLNVTPEWLRFGDISDNIAQLRVAHDIKHLALLLEIQSLDDRGLKLVKKMVGVLSGRKI